MKKQVIRLTEGDLHRIIKNTVVRMIHEANKKPPRMKIHDWSDFPYDDEHDVEYNGLMFAPWEQLHIRRKNSPVDKQEDLDRAFKDATDAVFGKPNRKDKLATEKRRKALEKLFKKIDVIDGKVGEYWDEYDTEMNSSDDE